MKIGPFPFWVISPFIGVQLWTYYCVLNASGLPALAVELSNEPHSGLEAGSVVRHACVWLSWRRAVAPYACGHPDEERTALLCSRFGMASATRVESAPTMIFALADQLIVDEFRKLLEPAHVAIGARANRSRPALSCLSAGRPRACSPASVSAPKLVLPVFAQRMMLWAARLRTSCFSPSDRRWQTRSSATSIVAIIRRSKSSAIIVKPPAGLVEIKTHRLRLEFPIVENKQHSRWSPIKELILQLYSATPRGWGPFYSALILTPEGRSPYRGRFFLPRVFAHLKIHDGFERMRLRGLSGASDEFHLVAIVPNLQTRALRLLGPPTGQVCASIA
jgi:hypothetical protein